MPEPTRPIPDPTTDLAGLTAEAAQAEAVPQAQPLVSDQIQMALAQESMNAKGLLARDGNFLFHVAPASGDPKRRPTAYYMSKTYNIPEAAQNTWWSALLGKIGLAGPVKSPSGAAGASRLQMIAGPLAPPAAGGAGPSTPAPVPPDIGGVPVVPGQWDAGPWFQNDGVGTSLPVMVAVPIFEGEDPKEALERHAERIGEAYKHHGDYFKSFGMEFTNEAATFGTGSVAADELRERYREEAFVNAPWLSDQARAQAHIANFLLFNKLPAGQLVHAAVPALTRGAARAATPVAKRMAQAVAGSVLTRTGTPVVVRAGAAAPAGAKDLYQAMQGAFGAQQGSLNPLDWISRSASARVMRGMGAGALTNLSNGLRAAQRVGVRVVPQGAGKVRIEIPPGVSDDVVAQIRSGLLQYKAGVAEAGENIVFELIHGAARVGAEGAALAGVTAATIGGEITARSLAGQDVDPLLEQAPEALAQGFAFGAAARTMGLGAARLQRGPRAQGAPQRWSAAFDEEILGGNVTPKPTPSGSDRTARLFPIMGPGREGPMSQAMVAVERTYRATDSPETAGNIARTVSALEAQQRSLIGATMAAGLDPAQALEPQSVAIEARLRAMPKLVDPTNQEGLTQVLGSDVRALLYNPTVMPYETHLWPWIEYGAALAQKATKAQIEALPPAPMTLLDPTAIAALQGRLVELGKKIHEADPQADVGLPAMLRDQLPPGPPSELLGPEAVLPDKYSYDPLNANAGEWPTAAELDTPKGLAMQQAQLARAAGGQPSIYVGYLQPSNLDGLGPFDPIGEEALVRGADGKYRKTRANAVPVVLSNGRLLASIQDPARPLGITRQIDVTRSLAEARLPEGGAWEFHTAKAAPVELRLEEGKLVVDPVGTGSRAVARDMLVEQTRADLGDATQDPYDSPNGLLNVAMQMDHKSVSQRALDDALSAADRLSTDLYLNRPTIESLAIPKDAPQHFVTNRHAEAIETWLDDLMAVEAARAQIHTAAALRGAAIGQDNPTRNLTTSQLGAVLGDDIVPTGASGEGGEIATVEFDIDGYLNGLPPSQTLRAIQIVPDAVLDGPTARNVSRRLLALRDQGWLYLATPGGSHLYVHPSLIPQPAPEAPTAPAAVDPVTGKLHPEAGVLRWRKPDPATLKANEEALRRGAALEYAHNFESWSDAPDLFRDLPDEAKFPALLRRIQVGPLGGNRARTSLRQMYANLEALNPARWRATGRNPSYFGSSWTDDGKWEPDATQTRELQKVWDARKKELDRVQPSYDAVVLMTRAFDKALAVDEKNNNTVQVDTLFKGKEGRLFNLRSLSRLTPEVWRLLEQNNKDLSSAWARAYHRWLKDGPKLSEQDERTLGTLRRLQGSVDIYSVAGGVIDKGPVAVNKLLELTSKMGEGVLASAWVSLMARPDIMVGPFRQGSFVRALKEHAAKNVRPDASYEERSMWNIIRRGLEGEHELRMFYGKQQDRLRRGLLLKMEETMTGKKGDPLSKRRLQLKGPGAELSAAIAYHLEHETPLADLEQAHPTPYQFSPGLVGGKFEITLAEAVRDARTLIDDLNQRVLPHAIEEVGWNLEIVKRSLAGIRAEINYRIDEALRRDDELRTAMDEWLASPRSKLPPGSIARDLTPPEKPIYPSESELAPTFDLPDAILAEHLKKVAAIEGDASLEPVAKQAALDQLTVELQNAAADKGVTAAKRERRRLVTEALRESEATGMRQARGTKMRPFEGQPYQIGSDSPSETYRRLQDYRGLGKYTPFSFRDLERLMKTVGKKATRLSAELDSLKGKDKTNYAPILRRRILEAAETHRTQRRNPILLDAEQRSPNAWRSLHRRNLGNARQGEEVYDWITAETAFIEGALAMIYRNPMARQIEHLRHTPGLPPQVSEYLRRMMDQVLGNPTAFEHTVDQFLKHELVTQPSWDKMKLEKQGIAVDAEIAKNPDALVQGSPTKRAYGRSIASLYAATLKPLKLTLLNTTEPPWTIPVTMQHLFEPRMWFGARAPLMFAASGIYATKTLMHSRWDRMLDSFTARGRRFDSKEHRQQLLDYGGRDANELTGQLRAEAHDSGSPAGPFIDATSRLYFELTGMAPSETLSRTWGADYYHRLGRALGLEGELLDIWTKVQFGRMWNDFSQVGQSPMSRTAPGRLLMYLNKYRLSKMGYITSQMRLAKEAALPSTRPAEWNLVPYGVAEDAPAWDGVIDEFPPATEDDPRPEPISLDLSKHDAELASAAKQLDVEPAQEGSFAPAFEGGKREYKAFIRAMAAVAGATAAVPLTTGLMTYVLYHLFGGIWKSEKAAREDVQIITDQPDVWIANISQKLRRSAQTYIQHTLATIDPTGLSPRPSPQATRTAHKAALETGLIIWILAGRAPRSSMMAGMGKQIFNMINDLAGYDEEPVEQKPWKVEWGPSD